MMKIKKRRAVVIFHKGEEVGSITAEYNLDNVPPEFHATAVSACDRRVNIYSDIHLTKEEIEEERRRFEEAEAARRNRPWWKKVFSP